MEGDRIDGRELEVNKEARWRYAEYGRTGWGEEDVLTREAMGETQEEKGVPSDGRGRAHIKENRNGAGWICVCGEKGGWRKKAAGWQYKEAVGRERLRRRVDRLTGGNLEEE